MVAMRTTPHVPQELVAQMTDADPYFSESAMSKEHAQRLTQQAQALKAELEALKPFLLSDDELALKLADIQTRATESGVWRADKGDGADERITYAVQKRKKWGYTEEEARADALKELQTNGYLDAIHAKRKEQEQDFEEPIAAYIASHHLDAKAEKAAVDALRKHTIDLTKLSPAESIKVAADFPSGNFLYHGTGTEQLVQILNTGILANSKILKQRENEAAKAEGRDTQIVRDNSGYEGVSWSMNGIDALPGDRYHLAGFVAAPEAVLSKGGQLAVPSRPSPNEVVLIDDSIAVEKYYTDKTQLELYEAYDRNSVLGGLLEIITQEDGDEPKLRAILPSLKDESYEKTLRDNYSAAQNGAITLSPDLLSSLDADGEIPVAAVWLQALVDTGRLKGSDFEGMSTAEVISAISAGNVTQLYAQLHRDADVYKESSSVEEVAIAVSVEQMYFVAARKDAETWLKVLARSAHKPAGILLYDDKKVRLENFASLHRGDHAELTKELQAAIKPDNKKYIDYSEVLGASFTDDMRTGHKRQVIAEKHLSNRGTIKKIDDKLVIER